MDIISGRIDRKLFYLQEDASEVNDARKQFNTAYESYRQAIQQFGGDSDEAKSMLVFLKKAQDNVKRAESNNQKTTEPDASYKGSPDTYEPDENEQSDEPEYDGSTGQPIYQAPELDKTNYGENTRYTSENWKDPTTADRQEAEDALFHTVGPLLDNPKWINSEWQNRGNPPPGYQPGGDAPRWTPEEVIFAMAGQPGMLFTGRKDNPSSPEYGNKGGSPLFRKAKKIARLYNRRDDKNLIADMYQNGFVPLLRMMQPGFDEGRSPFISYVMRNIESSMGHGVGATKQSLAVIGFNNDGLIGLKGILELDDPSQVRRAANQIGMKYRNSPSNVKTDDNPFGKYSPIYYRLTSEYADALESGDTEAISAVKNKIMQQIDRIEDDNVQILGASTGIGQAISTPDRKSSVNIASLDAPSDGGDDASGMAANIPGSDPDKVAAEKSEETEVVQLILDRAMKFDFGSLGPEWQQKMIDWGAKGPVKVNGPISITQLRYVIRTLGETGMNYPGKGKIRANVSVPRDAPKWCQYGEDPEIEPIPIQEGAVWKSKWVRNGYPSLQPTEISDEMTNEVREFEKLRIPTARSIKVKGSGRGEVVSKNAISTAIKSAKIKLMTIAAMERGQLGLDESKLTGPLLEDIKYADLIDREIIAEACDYLVDKLNKALNSDFSSYVAIRHPVINRAELLNMHPVDSLE